MNKKRKKKTFPPGTFIPKPARIMAILQLCVAFSLLLWILTQPFMGDLFTIKSHMLLYESVMGKDTSFTKEQRKVRETFFQDLPKVVQEKIAAGYESLKSELQSPFWLKLERSIKLVMVKTPLLELAWIFFSILIPILLLKRKEGAVPAVWLLLLITVAYAIDNRWSGAPRHKPQANLYPTEETLLQHYLKEPLKANVLEQADQLMAGWKLYLVDQWTKEAASDQPKKFADQVEKGRFAFDVAQLGALGNISLVLSVNTPPSQLSLMTLGIYLFWNSLFALIVTKYCRRLI